MRACLVAGCATRAHRRLPLCAKHLLVKRLADAGLPPPIEEHAFAWPDRRWRFDLAYPDALLAVEVEGGAYRGGRHTSPRGFEGDCEKYAEALIRGYRVLRVTTGMVEDNRAVEYVRRALEARELRR